MGFRSRWAALGIAFLTASCGSDQLKGSASEQDRPANEPEVLEMITQGKTPDDARVAEQLYQLAEGLAALTRSRPPADVSRMMSQAVISKDFEIDLSNDGNAALAALINSQLRERRTSLGAIAAGMVREGVQYRPTIYIPNKRHADFQRAPVIAIGEGVAAPQGKSGDHIVGWRIDDDGRSHRVILGENEAKAMVAPLLIVTNDDTPEEGAVVPTSAVRPQEGAGDVGALSFSYGEVPILEYKIAYNYEGSGNNDYSYVFRRLDYSGYIGEEPDRMHIADISPSQVGTTFYPGDKFIYVPSGIRGAWVVTFEYDWYASKKSVTVSEGPNSVTLTPRMKYSNEYYQRMYMDGGQRTTKVEKGHIKVTMQYDTYPNLAIGAHASASSTYGGYNAYNVNDTSTDTTVGGPYSWTNAADGYLPQWLELDFGVLKTFSAVDLYTSAGYEIKDYSIQYWNGFGWIDLVHEVGNTQVQRWHSFSTVSASKVRVVGWSGPDVQPHYVRINEFRVY
jgi:hypothetical protein